VADCCCVLCFVLCALYFVFCALGFELCFVMAVWSGNWALIEGDLELFEH